VNAGRRTTLAAALAAICTLSAQRAGAADDTSLFDPERYKPLTAEDKALRPGDVLTIVVQENATATSSADSRGQRKLGGGVELDTNIGRHAGSHTITGAASTENDGGGRTQRSGRLLATLSVRVIAVRDNGDLVVQGNQVLTINGEAQSISLSGVVRPRDVGDNNAVLSNRIAEARIEFDGEGFITDKSRPGWIARALTFLGL
jgi:flagellar L-ring protein FlgH